MRVKGICPECGEIVDCGDVVCAENSDIVFEHEPKERPIGCLVLFHPRKVGHQAVYTISQQTSEVLAIHCGGSLRPPSEIVPVH